MNTPGPTLQETSGVRPAAASVGAAAPGAASGHLNGFFKINRTDTTRELLRDPKAFTLLALIAYRAKWSTCLSVHNLKPGQALIGDHRVTGLTPKAYREAKERLAKWNLAAFQGTNKGTVATLMNTEVFDIFGASRGEQDGKPRANQGQTKGEQGASQGRLTKTGKTGETNKTGKTGKGEWVEGDSYGRLVREL